MTHKARLSLLPALPLFLALGARAQAATLLVGPGQSYAAPSAAAAAARDGDVIAIAPGNYFDCAVWRADGLTVQGSGPGVVLTDLACEGKAAFIARGRNLTLRDLTFTRIRVPDRNGAGVRAEGGDLTIERCRFINDQIGIFAPEAMSGTLTVRDSVFERNGTPDAPQRASDIAAGRIDTLRVEQSRFQGARGGGVITSAARRAELAGNRITSGAASSYLIGILNGGSLIMQDNTITLLSSVPSLAAVLVAEDGDAPQVGLVLHGTGLVDQVPAARAVLLRNWSGAVPDLAANSVASGDVEVTEGGVTMHRIRHEAGAWRDWLRAQAGRVRHALAQAVRAVYRCV